MLKKLPIILLLTITATAHCTQANSPTSTPSKALSSFSWLTAGAITTSALASYFGYQWWQASSGLEDAIETSAEFAPQYEKYKELKGILCDHTQAGPILSKDQSPKALTELTDLNTSQPSNLKWYKENDQLVQSYKRNVEAGSPTGFLMALEALPLEKTLKRKAHAKKNQESKIRGNMLLTALSGAGAGYLLWHRFATK